MVVDDSHSSGGDGQLTAANENWQTQRYSNFGTRNGDVASVCPEKGDLADGQRKMGADSNAKITWAGARGWISRALVRTTQP
jgi:hypothetical protein